MVAYQVIFDSFLSKILEDEWGTWTPEEIKEDMLSILESALPYFKFPRVELDHDEEGFTDPNFGRAEVEIIATYMKVEWLNRNILTWENIKPLYDERDFSQGNLLDKFTKLLNVTQEKADRLERNYYRSVGGKPYEYRNLAKNDN